MVEDLILLELKAVETINPISEAQLLTYMKLLEKPKGILLNFNCHNLFHEGQKTFVNEFYRKTAREIDINFTEKNPLMKKKLYIILIGLTFPVKSFCALEDKVLIIYDAPSGITHNSSYTVQVRKAGGEWKDLYEYDAEVGRHKGTFHSSFVYFDSDFSKKIEVKVTKNEGSIDKVRIRPASYGVKYKQNGNAISFTLDKPLKVSVEFNGDIYNNLQVFANPIENNRPKEGDPGVIYFGPGLWNPGVITLRDNQILYIAGGAVVRGSINVNNAGNVKIIGRGILDNSNHSSSDKTRMIKITNSSKVTIDGIFITDSQQWTIVPSGSDQVIINNVKILNNVIYSDGIDLVSCQNVVINDVFIRNGDDCISIKAKGNRAKQGYIHYKQYFLV